MKSQNAQVLSLLKRNKNKGVSADDALSYLHCWRLAARVHDLRKAGHEIKTTTEAHEGGKHARYFLV